MKVTRAPRIEDTVEVVDSPYHQVSIGQTGILKAFYAGGYVVEIHKVWEATALHAKPTEETRAMWFDIGQVKVATLQP